MWGHKMKDKSLWNKASKLNVREYDMIAFALRNDYIFVKSHYMNYCERSEKYVGDIIDRLISLDIFKQIGEESYGVVRTDEEIRHLE